MFLVTGGSGFLGRELIKRLDGDIRVIARNESQLVKLKEEFPHVEVIVGDISDKYDCWRACKGVSRIYHLAAMKHIGLAEENVKECIDTNVIGTMNILNESWGKQSVILISTDKAAQVNGVYGATKFLCERLFREWDKLNPTTAYRVVRYGNVLYSSGSVLCKWREKIAKGEAITITDPEATRFYWPVDEAVDLIFDCIENAKDATPYVPEMKAAKMGDLLEATMKKYGEVPVNQIGLQSGENMHETIDGNIFSNKVYQYSVEELMEII